MIGYPYTYDDNLTVEESLRRSQDFGRGFTTAVTIFGSYKVIQSLTNVKPAFAKDVYPAPPGKGSNGSSPVPGPGKGKSTTVSKRQKGALSGAAGLICKIAADSGEFWVGIACGVVVIAVMQIINSPTVPKS